MGQALGANRRSDQCLEGLLVKARQAYGRLQIVARDHQQQTAMRKSRSNLPRPIGALVVEQVHLVLKDRLILNNISFQLDPGESLGVVGLNASGQDITGPIAGWAVSTKQWARDPGRIRCTSLDAGGLGQHSAICPSRSSCSRARWPRTLPASAKLSNMKKRSFRQHDPARVHDLILRLPKGYDTEIGEGGNTLSVGSGSCWPWPAPCTAIRCWWCLMSLTRQPGWAGGNAPVGNPAELKTQGATVVIISHKPSILRDVDKLLVLNQGRQAHYGPRATILSILEKERTELALGAGSGSGSGKTPRFPGQPRHKPLEDSS